MSGGRRFVRRRGAGGSGSGLSSCAGGGGARRCDNGLSLMIAPRAPARPPRPAGHEFGWSASSAHANPGWLHEVNCDNYRRQGRERPKTKCLKGDTPGLSADAVGAEFKGACSTGVRTDAHAGDRPSSGAQGQARRLPQWIFGKRLALPGRRATFGQLPVGRSEPVAAAIKSGVLLGLTPASLGGSWLHQRLPGVPAGLGGKRRVSGASVRRRLDRARSGRRNPGPRVSAVRPHLPKNYGWPLR